MLVTYRATLARMAAVALILLLAIGAWAQKTQRFGTTPSPTLLAGVEEAQTQTTPGIQSPQPRNKLLDAENAALTLGQP